MTSLNLNLHYQVCWDIGNAMVASLQTLYMLSTKHLTAIKTYLLTEKECNLYTSCIDTFEIIQLLQ